jgi:hypothetical protein
MRTVDRDTAKRLVTDYINSSYNVEGDELVVIEEETIERPYGWVFVYNSRQYLETGQFRYMLAGNGPIVVERADGSMHQLGTALPMEESMRLYEERRNSGTVEPR